MSYSMVCIRSHAAALSAYFSGEQRSAQVSRQGEQRAFHSRGLDIRDVSSSGEVLWCSNAATPITLSHTPTPQTLRQREPPVGAPQVQEEQYSEAVLGRRAVWEKDSKTKSYS